MPTSVHIPALGNAIVTLLNGAVLSQTFTAARAYVPNKGVLDLGGYDVMVVAKRAGPFAEKKSHGISPSAARCSAMH